MLAARFGRRIDARFGVEREYTLLSIIMKAAFTAPAFVVGFAGFAEEERVVRAWVGYNGGGAGRAG